MTEKRFDGWSVRNCHSGSGAGKKREGTPKQQKTKNQPKTADDLAANDDASADNTEAYVPQNNNQTGAHARAQQVAEIK